MSAAAGRPPVAAVEAMYQFVLWLVPVLDGMPRSRKFLLGDRVSWFVSCLFFGFS
jgi:hypothetical protein